MRFCAPLLLMRGLRAGCLCRNPRGVFAPWNLARGDMFGPTVQRLIDSHRSGEEPLSSGHDYRQALELAIALKLSAAEGHRRVTLPLEDRALKAYPHLYRLNGGDRAGWQSIGYTGPPQTGPGDRFGFAPHEVAGPQPEEPPPPSRL